MWAAGAPKPLADFIAGHVEQETFPPAEHILSPEQAQKYTRQSRPARHNIEISRRRRPDLPDLVTLLDAQVPEGTTLLAGKAQLWQELRFPTPYLYVAALGRAIAEVEFDPTSGWRDTQNTTSSGESLAPGLGTPILYWTVRRQKTSASD